MINGKVLDKLNGGNCGEVYHQAYRYVDQLQGLPVAVQVQSICILFLHLCRVLKLKVVDVLMKGERIIKEAEQADLVELRALNQYLREEIKK